MDRSLSASPGSLSPLLDAFVAAAAEGNFTRAAEGLGIPQSTLSRRLRALERALEVTLFLPDGRGVRLSAQGRDLLARVHGPLRALDEALAAVHQDADSSTGLVRFGFPLTLGPASVPALLADFHRIAPGIRLYLVQAHGAALSQMLTDGDLDLAIVIPAPAGLPNHSLGHQPIRLSVAQGHRLEGRDRVTLAELADERFIANPPSYHLREQTERWCGEAGFTPDVAFEITEFETIRALVAQGLGIALLPPAELPRQDLVEIPLVGVDARRSIGLATGTAVLNPAAQRLYAYLAEHAATGPERQSAAPLNPSGRSQIG